MKINKAEVEYIANLARISLDDSEVKRLKKELSSILNYMDLLNEVDTTDVEPTVHTRTITNALRPDELRESQNKQDALVNAPTRQNDFFVVPKVIE